MNPSVFVRVVIVSCVFLGAITVLAQEADSTKSLSPSQVVQRDVRSLQKALYSGDVDTVLKHAHPKIIRTLGGKESARSTLKKLLKTIQIQNMRTESFRFPKEPEFVKTKEHEFVVVPTLTVVAVGTQRVESLNFQFGVRDLSSKEWKYIEGSRVNQGNVRELFPDFPKSFTFPKFYRKKLPQAR